MPNAGGAQLEQAAALLRHLDPADAQDARRARAAGRAAGAPPALTLTLTPTLTPTLTLTLTPAPAPTPTPTLTRREIKDGQYGPLPQFVANQLVALPMLLLISVCVLVPPYLITDLPWASFGPVLLMYTACMWAFEGMAMYFSLTDNPIVGMALYVQSWFATYPYPYLYPYPYPSLSPYPYPYPYPYP